MSLLATVVLGSGLAWGQTTYKPDEGWGESKTPLEPPEVGTDRGEFERALAIYQNGQIQPAIVLCDRIVKTWQTGQWVERAMLLKARAFFKLGDLRRCDKTLTEMRKKFPATFLAGEIADLKFAVGSAYLDKNNGSGVKILRELVEERPYGPRSDEAEIRIGRYLMKEGDYTGAAQELALLLNTYRESGFREEAAFLKAKCAYLSNEGAERDVLPYVEGQAGLDAYLKEYPEGKFVEEAKALRGEIDSALAQKQYLVGRYYRKQGRAVAAEKYFGAVVKRYPGTPWAALAERELASLRPAAAEPKPAVDAPKPAATETKPAEGKRENL